MGTALAKLCAPQRGEARKRRTGVNPTTCIHFRGIQHETCEAGVALDSVKDTSATPYEWPCLRTRSGRPCATSCEKYQAPTAEQIAEDEAKISALVARIEAGETPPGCHVLRTGEARNPLGTVASLDMIVAVGFGYARVTRDGVEVLDGERAADRGRYVTVRDAERLACRTARTRRRQHQRRAHDWRITITGALWEAEWQRQRPGKWVCVRAGDGFA
jgi:hypothetical protein